jgi:hypothetical protein
MSNIIIIIIIIIRDFKTIRLVGDRARTIFSCTSAEKQNFRILKIL